MEASSVHLIVFSWIDYSLFSAMLILSLAIGIYFGCFGSKQKSKSEYLLGGKTMKVLPIAISLIASDTSGVALLAVPADIYRYGAYYLWTCCSTLIVALGTSYIYIPVFHKLQLTSSYEYLHLRFDRKVRTLASLLFTISIILYNPIVIYIPALALAQATSISVHLVAPIVSAICVFYTVIGGLKAVVWTDTIQMVVMAAVMALILVLGILNSGGMANIISVASKGHRLDILNFNIDPTTRDGIIAAIVGSLASGLSFASVSQSVVQRFMAVPTLADARKVTAMFFSGILIVKLVSVFTGLIMYTRYSTCDPLSNGFVTRPDQILPYYIMDVAGNIPGLPGLFIAGIFSASLSTLSAALNTLSATIYEDFIRPFLDENITEQRSSIILKLIALTAGIICTAMVFVVENMGGIFPMVNSIVAITGGPLLGLFTLGMLFPIANSKGALCGAISGLAFVTWVIAGNQWYKSQSYYVDPVKPFSTTGCTSHANISNPKQIEYSELPLYIYRVTFWYYTVMGTIVTISIGLIISWFTRAKFSPVDPDLLSPVLHLFRRPEKIKNEESEPLSECNRILDLDAKEDILESKM